MRRLDAATWQRLRAEAEILTTGLRGDKVLRLPDGTMLKLFRRKRLLSTAFFLPYASRFRRAAEELTRRGVPTVIVLDVFRVPTMQRDVVHYRPLEGITLREALPGKIELLEATAAFLAELHGKGVYFRAAHFGNLIVRPDGTLGLIDVSEARFRARPLTPSLRARNFKHLTRYEEDRAALDAFSRARFLTTYRREAALKPSAEMTFLARLAKMEPSFINVSARNPAGERPSDA